MLSSPLIQLTLALYLQFPTIVSTTGWENVSSILQINYTKVDIKDNSRHKRLYNSHLLLSIQTRLNRWCKKLTSEYAYSLTFLHSYHHCPSAFVWVLLILQAQFSGTSIMGPSLTVMVDSFLSFFWTVLVCTICTPIWDRS